MIRDIMILVVIITIIYNFKNICTNITKEHFNSPTNVYCHNYDENNPRLNGKGYQCTIGCKSNVDKYGRYPFKSMKEANNACKAAGFNRLCTKKEVIDANVDLCCSGWTHSLVNNSANKYEVGYTLRGATPKNKLRPGCGVNGEKWKNWAGHDFATRHGSAAHCCDLNHDARNLVNNVKTERTKLSTELANKEMKMHTLLTDINTSYQSTEDINNKNIQKTKEVKELIKKQNIKCNTEIQNIKNTGGSNINNYRKFKLGIECGEGKSCRTNASKKSLSDMILDERNMFNNTANNISHLNNELSNYRQSLTNIRNRKDMKNTVILRKKKREIDELTAANTSQIKKHCNLIKENIKSIDSSSKSQEALNTNAIINSSLSFQEFRSAGNPDAPNRSTLKACNTNYELPNLCNAFVN